MGNKQQHHAALCIAAAAVGQRTTPTTTTSLTCARSLLASLRMSMAMGADGAAPGISGRGRPAAQALGRGAAAPAAPAPLAAAPAGGGGGASRTTAPYLSSSSICESSMAMPRSSSMWMLATEEWSPLSISAAMRAASAMLILDLLQGRNEQEAGCGVRPAGRDSAGQWA